MQESNLHVFKFIELLAKTFFSSKLSGKEVIVRKLFRRSRALGLLVKVQDALGFIVRFRNIVISCIRWIAYLPEIRLTDSYKKLLNYEKKKC